MKKKMVKVLYYERTEYGFTKHNETMTESEYLDMIMFDDVIVKRKKYL